MGLFWRAPRSGCSRPGPVWGQVGLCPAPLEAADRARRLLIHHPRIVRGTSSMPSRLCRAMTGVESRLQGHVRSGSRRLIMRTHLIALAAVLSLATLAAAGELDREFRGSDGKVSATAPPAPTSTGLARTEMDDESPTQAGRFHGGWGWGRGWGWGGGWGWGRGWGGWGWNSRVGWGGWGWGRGWGWSPGWGWGARVGWGWGGWGWGRPWAGWGGGSGWGWPSSSFSVSLGYWPSYSFYPSWGWGFSF